MHIKVHIKEQKCLFTSDDQFTKLNWIVWNGLHLQYALIPQST